MTPGAARVWPVAVLSELRRACLPAGVVLGFVLVIPPVSSPGAALRARRSPSVLCLCHGRAGTRCVVGAPRALYGSKPGRGRFRAQFKVFAERLASQRERHREPVRSALVLGLFMAVAIAWRTPGAVDAIESHPLLVPVEAVSLVVGVAFWLSSSNQVRSAAFAPAYSRGAGRRGHVGVWTVAYLAGFSSASWYSGFHHVVGQGLSAAADQQFSTGVLWLVGDGAFHAGRLLEHARMAAHDEDNSISGSRAGSRAELDGLGLLGPGPSGWGNTGMSGSAGACRGSRPQPRIGQRPHLSEASARSRRRARGQRAGDSCGPVNSFSRSEIAPRASEVLHSVAVLTTSPRRLPAAEPGTSMLESSKMLSSVNEQAAWSSRTAKAPHAGRRR